MAIKTIIASREYKLKNGNKVTVNIGCPEPFPDFKDYYCVFQILGLEKEKSGRGGGIDAVQALIHGLEMAGICLATSPEFLSGELTWDGSPDGKNTGLIVPKGF